MENKLLTVIEAAKILRVSKNKVYELIHERKLKALELNGLKIRESAIDAFLSNLEDNFVEGGLNYEC